jgi:hypothetical protein
MYVFMYHVCVCGHSVRYKKLLGMPILIGFSFVGFLLFDSTVTSLLLLSLII